MDDPLSKSPRVFVVQKQMRFDREKGELVPKFELGPAEEFGELVYLLSPTAGPFNPESILRDLHRILVDYDHTKDHLLLIGNPCLIGWAVSVAAQYGDGYVATLQWSGKDKKYMSVTADLMEKEKEN